MSPWCRKKARPSHGSSLCPIVQRQGARDYGLRWGIEAMFSDFKTRGFNLEASQIERTDQLDRLVLVLALALYWAVSTGMWDALENRAPAEKKAAAVQRKNVARSLMSLFKRGCGASVSAFSASSPHHLSGQPGKLMGGKVRPHPACRARGPVDPCPALDLALRAWLCPGRRTRPICASSDGECLGGGGEWGRGNLWSVSRRHRGSTRAVSGSTWTGSRSV